MPRQRERDELEELLDEVDRLRTRYGSTEGLEQQMRLEGSMRRRQQRLRHIRRELEELTAEAATLDRELLGFRAGMIAYLADIAQGLRNEHAEGWSPTPIIGYRMWALRSDGLHGARQAWVRRSLTATCADTSTDDIEIPHTDGRCGRLGCGIYAAKNPDPVLDSFTPDDVRGHVIGRVALTGKVVEHDTGYRAEHAEAVAAVAVGSSGVLATRDPEHLDALFAEPAKTMRAAALQSFWTRHMIIEYLTIEEDPWT